MNKTLKELDLTLVNENETLDDLQLDGLHLIQKKEGFRFGVDAVLLANFANVNRKHSVFVHRYRNNSFYYLRKKKS